MNERDATAGDHLGDEAELYALGLLDESEVPVLERHVAACDACARRVGLAADAAAQLGALLPPATPSASLSRRIAAASGARPATEAPAQSARVVPFAPRARALRVPALWGNAVAAVVAAAFVASFAWLQVGRMQERVHATDVALATIVHSHFLHVSLTPVQPSTHGAAAKALYGREGRWVYVVIDEPARGVHVVATYGGAEHDLGEPLSDGETATLFARVPERATAIALRRASTTLARATLAYHS